MLGGQNAEAGVEFCNLVRLAAASAGQFPRIEFLPPGPEPESEVAEVLARLAPDLVLATGGHDAPGGFRIDCLRKGQRFFKRQVLGSHYRYNLTVKLMRALRGRGWIYYPGAVLTAPFPMWSTPCSAALGLAPTCRGR